MKKLKKLLIRLLYGAPSTGVSGIPKGIGKVITPKEWDGNDKLKEVNWFRALNVSVLADRELIYSSVQEP